MKVGDVVKLNWWRKAKAHSLQIDEDAVGIIVASRRVTQPDGNPNGDFTIHQKFQVLFSNAPRWLDRSDLMVVNEDR